MVLFHFYQYPVASYYTCSSKDPLTDRSDLLDSAMPPDEIMARISGSQTAVRRQSSKQPKHKFIYGGPLEMVGYNLVSAA